MPSMVVMMITLIAATWCTIMLTILMSITCTTITMTTITILSELITTNQASFGHHYGNNSFLAVLVRLE